MDDLSIEVDLLTKGRNSLEESLNYFKDTDSVSEEDYEKLGNFTEKINDILIEKQVKLRNLEECYGRK